jgi:hypothetical protein
MTDREAEMSGSGADSVEPDADGAEAGVDKANPLGLRDASFDTVVKLLEGMAVPCPGRDLAPIRTALEHLLGSGRIWAAAAELRLAPVRGPAAPVRPATLQLQTDHLVGTEPGIQGRAVLGNSEVRVWIAGPGVSRPGISLALAAVDQTGELQVSEPVALGDPGHTLALTVPWLSEDIPALVLIAFAASPES